MTEHRHAHARAAQCADDGGARLEGLGLRVLDRDFVPAKTPRGIADKLYEECRRAMQVTAVQERLAKVGTDPMPMSTEELGKYFREDALSTAKLMQQVGIKPSD